MQGAFCLVIYAKWMIKELKVRTGLVGEDGRGQKDLLAQMVLLSVEKQTCDGTIRFFYFMRLVDRTVFV